MIGKGGCGDRLKKREDTLK